MAKTYTVRTWDSEADDYTPQDGLPWRGLTLWQLRDVLRALRNCGYEAGRVRGPNGDHDSDWAVLVESEARA